MKLLLCSDIHCDLAAAQSIVDRSNDVDVVIVAGDLGNVRRGLDRTIGVLRNIDRPTVLVPGNAESDGELRHECRDWPNGHALHGACIAIDGIEFFGIGGGIPVTPFGSWSFDLTEDDAAQLLSNCPDNAIVVSHSPPKGAVDVSSSGRSLGSTALRQTIERTHPRLVVCGHIHDSAGRHEMIGDTPVVNAGPAAMLWEL